MFFGIEVKSSAPGKPVKFESAVKLTQAVLEPGKNGKKEPVSLMVESEKKQFILCVLDPNLSWQCALDLVFAAGSDPKFFIKGTGTVHLTGYETIDDLDLEMDMSSDDSDTENGLLDGVDNDEEEELDNEPVVPAKGVKKAAKAVTNGKRVPVKREIPPEELEGDEDESDDSDFDVSDLDSDEDEVDIDESLDEDEDEDEEEEEEEGSDEDMEEDDEDDD